MSGAQAGSERTELQEARQGQGAVILVRQVPPHAYASSLGGQIAGNPGDRLRLVLKPQTYFRVDKIMATDTSENPGRGTRVMGAYVGNVLQRPAPPSSGTLTLFFAQDALGNSVRWMTCEPSLEIAVEISFDVACTFDLSLYGQMWN